MTKQCRGSPARFNVILLGSSGVRRPLDFPQRRFVCGSPFSQRLHGVEGSGLPGHRLADFTPNSRFKHAERKG